jgi:hypothetical protein
MGNRFPEDKRTRISLSQKIKDAIRKRRNFNKETKKEF